MHGDGVKAVVERDVTGERVVDALLRFDRYDRAPAGHGDGPFDGVGADIGAAVDGDDAVSMDLVPSFDQMQRELHFDGVVRAAFQHLVTDPGSRLGIRLVHAIVETVGDHRAVIGCGQHEGKLASDVAHETPQTATGAATGPRERITCHRVIPPAPVYRLRGRDVQIAPTGTGPRHRAFSSPLAE